MSASCGDLDCLTSGATDPAYKRALWLVLAINAAMFGFQIIASFMASSASLYADALDFLGDAFAYGITIYAVGKSLRWRSSVSMVKASIMLAFGLSVVWRTWSVYQHTELPVAGIMGIMGVASLISNVTCAFLLYPHRKGDSNRLSIWLCSRNDVIANLAVIAAAGAVAITSSKIPDIIVGLGITILVIHSSIFIFRQALKELSHKND